MGTGDSSKPQKNRDQGNQNEAEEHVDTSFGIGPWKTNALKESHHLVVFAVLSGLMGMFAGLVRANIFAQAMSFEKAYNFEPTTVMQSLFTFEYMGVLMVVASTGFIANYMSIPKMTGIAGIVYGIGMASSGFLHYFKPAANWPPALPPIPFNATGSSNFFTCNHPEVMTQMKPPTWDGKDIYKMMLDSSMLCYGILSAIRWGPMPFLFFDNNIINKSKVGVYLAITICISELSRPFGDLFSKYVNELPVDLGDTNIPPKNQLFITAWWLGIIVFGFMTSVVSIPMLFLPAHLLSSSKQSQQVNKASFKAVDKNIKIVGDDIAHVNRGAGMSMWQKVKTYFGGVPRIFSNPVFIILFCLSGIVVIPVVGLSLVNLQYTMFEFNIDSDEAQKADVLTNFVANVFAAIGGAIVCSRIHRKRDYLKFILGCVFISFVLLPVSFFLGCDDTTIHGLDNEDFGAPINKDPTDKCLIFCDVIPKFPVCGSDGKNYLNPCHAGCPLVSPQGYYFDCKYVQVNTSITPAIAIPGLCKENCHDQFVHFSTVYTISTLIYKMADIPKILLALRLIAPRDRGIAFSALGVANLLSSFLGPLILVRFFTGNCVVWFTDTICLYFDRKNIRLLKTGVEFNTYLFSFILWLIMLKLNNVGDKKTKNKASIDSEPRTEVAIVEKENASSKF